MPEPFSLHVPQAELDDLRERLGRTRFADEVRGAGWDYGTPTGYLRELVRHWREAFDWRAQERALNAIPQFRARAAGFDVHFLHVRGRGPSPLPLVLTHGWPSSPYELRRVLGPLSDPAAHGGDPADAFDVVVPSMPGFGFSERPRGRGFVRVDRVWRELLVDVLGYRRFVAHGTDVGARVTSALGRDHGDVVAAIHLGSVDLDWPDPLPPEDALGEEERDYLARVRRWEREEGAYADLQATRPQSLAHALEDSPAGLAAWIVEKFRAWSDCGGEVERRFSKDELLLTVSLYWFSRSIGSSMRRYFERRHDPAATPAGFVGTPTAIAMFPGERELVVPRRFAERSYRIVRWTEPPRGGHFPALEEPGLLVEDLRAAFRPYR